MYKLQYINIHIVKCLVKNVTTLVSCIIVQSFKWVLFQFSGSSSPPNDSYLYQLLT